MSRENLSIVYNQRIQQAREAIRIRSLRINYISAARLIALVGTVWLLVIGIRDHQILFYTASFLLLLLFLALVSLYNRQKGEREFHRQLEELNRTELACLEHDFHHLPDGGHHTDLSHPWSHDLDLFGRGSLFQYLNRTATLEGDRLLAQWLTREPEERTAVVERQGIIGDLAGRLPLRQEYTVRGRLIGEKEEDLENISTWLSAASYITRNRWLFYLALLVGPLSLVITVAGFLDTSMFWYLFFLSLFNFTLLSPFLHRTNQYQSSISRKHRLLEGYARLLKIIAEGGFSHPVLKGKSQQARTGMKEVKRLSKLLNIFDQRLNMLLGAVFNGLFLFDFIMLHLLERWKRRNRAYILEWIGLTGWTDAMASLAGFTYNHPGFVQPEFTDEQGDTELKATGHPLIPDRKRVVNDLHIKDERVVVITGANMAGKSTFLRTLGINMVLAYAGCPVCAEKFRTGFSGLFTSMRTADSLADEESYFLAEIRRLQLIVRRMEAGTPLLILLDEVLKGTNTTDKKLGSVGLIRRAVQYPVRCFIATHDLSLGELEESEKGRVVNYCFESYIKGMELTFDYTIRRGIATNMNASFLMKQMGIMD